MLISFSVLLDSALRSNTCSISAIVPLDTILNSPTPVATFHGLEKAVLFSSPAPVAFKSNCSNFRDLEIYCSEDRPLALLKKNDSISTIESPHELLSKIYSLAEVRAPNAAIQLFLKLVQPAILAAAGVIIVEVAAWWTVAVEIVPARY